MTVMNQGLVSRTLQAFLVLGILLGVTSDAKAAFKLALDDPFTVGIDVLLDDPDLDGVITHLGTVGSFSVNFTAGISKPTLGSASEPRLDLVSLSVSGTSGVLDLLLTDTGFVGGAGAGVVSIGGTLDSALEYSAFWDPGNGEFALTNLIGAPLVFARLPGDPPNQAFSGVTASIGVGNSTGYSLTQVVRIAHFGNEPQATSFDAALIVIPDDRTVPEPAALALFGLGLVGVAAGRRRWNRRSSSKS